MKQKLAPERMARALCLLFLLHAWIHSPADASDASDSSESTEADGTPEPAMAGESDFSELDDFAQLSDERTAELLARISGEDVEPIDMLPDDYAKHAGSLDKLGFSAIQVMPY